jgi:hypothetical protein
MSLMKRPHSIALGLVLVALSSAVAVAEVASDDPAAPGQGVDRVTQIEEPAREALGVLREARGGDDSMPADAAAAFTERASFGMNPALSRLAIANLRNSIFVVPARGHTCASMLSGAGAVMQCPKTSDISAGRAGASTAMIDGTAIAIWGVVRDGIESIELRIGGEIQAVEPQANVYLAIVPAGSPLESVSYVGPSGRVTYPIYDPSKVFDSEAQH